MRESPLPPISLRVDGPYVEMRFVARDMHPRLSYEREEPEKYMPHPYREYAAAVMIDDWKDAADLERKQAKAAATLLRSARVTFRLLEANQFDASEHPPDRGLFACQREPFAAAVIVDRIE